MRIACKSVCMSCHLVGTPILFYTCPCMFSYVHTSITYGWNDIPFGILHSTYMRPLQNLRDTLVFVCMLSLFRCFAGSIAGPYAGSCSRTSRGATHFPNTNTSVTVIPRRSLRRSLYNNPSRGNTHSKKISVQHTQATCRLSGISPPAPVSFGLEVFMHRFPFGATCARMGHRAYFEHEIFTLEAPTHTGVLEHCSVAGMD